eukprot:CAMPEP_0184691994 /NCGR_PEP_ID=MMETSP0313-20130426/653_1 /TAXON_ID=2792 /ORGANISM="Porphyridium aerugineum, Strain SAG 1380-2" /LENGTH=154 /DNA_ID=CAMNT_0027149787 /DNA_START=398 /DNA_END=862 /DNA_ORIENTATION=-
MAMRNGIVVCTTGANGAAYCYLANKATTPAAGNTAAMALNSSQMLANQKMMMMNRRMDLSSMTNNNNSTYSPNTLLSPPSQPQSQSVSYLPTFDQTNVSSKNTSGRGSRRNSNNNGCEHNQYSCEFMGQSLLDNSRFVEVDASPVSPVSMQKKH